MISYLCVYYTKEVEGLLPFETVSVPSRC